MTTEADLSEAVDFVAEMVRVMYSEEPIKLLTDLATFPIMVQSPGQTLTLTSVDDLTEALTLFRTALKSLGVASVRSAVQTYTKIDDELSMVTLINTRLDTRGASMGAHRSTYVVAWEDGAWRVRSLSVGDEPDGAQVRAAIETFFAVEFKGRAVDLCTAPGAGK